MRIKRLAIAVVAVLLGAALLSAILSAILATVAVVSIHPTKRSPTVSIHAPTRNAISTGEVIDEVRETAQHGSTPLRAVHCHETSSVAWTCSVQLSDGRERSAKATWSASSKVLAVALTPE